MDWSRTQIGLIGDRSGPDQFRIELAVLPDETGDRLVCLHDEATVGTFARVFVGQLRQGGFALPLAVKVQRDTALSGEAARSVAAKFDCERLAYRRLQADAAGRPVAARHHDFAATGDPNAVGLPPSIVCRHAAHALKPVCPKCGAPLSEPLGATSEERRLVCERCGEAFFCRDEVKKQIVRRTVRVDDACAGCDQDEPTCMRSAQFLNFFSARLLAFERLDLDLADFLEERDVPAQRKWHPGFWAGYSPGPPGDGLARLAELLGVFRAVVAGVTSLHKVGLTHFDLKPRNICLRVEEGRLEIRLIDLGFADVPEESLAYLRQVQGEKKLETDYAAPELVRPGFDKLVAAVGPIGPDGYEVRIRPAPFGTFAPYDPLVEEGDQAEVHLSEARSSWTGVVSKVERSPQELRLVLTGEGQPTDPGVLQAAIRIRRRAGPAADLFSLGIILLELLTGEANVGRVREGLGGLLEGFLSNPAGGMTTQALTPGVLAQAFARLPLATASFAPLFDRLESRFGEARAVAEELFGIALRLVYRWQRPPLATYVPSRAAATDKALERLRADLAHFEGILTAARERRAVEAREGVLRGTSARLQQVLASWAPALPKPATESSLPFDPTRFRHVLSIAGDKNFAEASLRRLLRDYGNDASRLLAHLKQFGQPDPSRLAPVSPPRPEVPPPRPQPDFNVQPLVDLLSLGMTRDATLITLASLRNIAENVRQLLSHPDRLTEPYRIQGKAWLAQVEPWLRILKEFEAGLDSIKGLADRVYNLFVVKVEKEIEKSGKEQGGPKPRPLVFRLNPGMRRLLREVDAHNGVERVRCCFKTVRPMWGQLERRWDEVMAAWTRVPPTVRVPLTSFVNRAQRSKAELGKKCDDWWADASWALEQLENYVKDVAAFIAQPWDRSLQPRWYGTPRCAQMTFDAEIVAWHERRKPLEIVQRLAALHLGPVAFVQAHLLIGEYEVLYEMSGQGG